MDKARAEEQALVWAHWTGQETHVDGPSTWGYWEYRVVHGEGRAYWHHGGDLTAGANPSLRRAIEAKAFISLDYEPHAKVWWAWIAPRDTSQAQMHESGPTLEQALYAAALKGAADHAG